MLLEWYICAGVSSHAIFRIQVIQLAHKATWDLLAEYKMRFLEVSVLKASPYSMAVTNDGRGKP